MWLTPSTVLGAQTATLDFTVSPVFPEERRQKYLKCPSDNSWRQLLVNSWRDFCRSLSIFALLGCRSARTAGHGQGVTCDVNVSLAVHPVLGWEQFCEWNHGMEGAAGIITLLRCDRCKSKNGLQPRLETLCWGTKADELLLFKTAYMNKVPMFLQPQSRDVVLACTSDLLSEPLAGCCRRQNQCKLQCHKNQSESESWIMDLTVRGLTVSTALAKQFLVISVGF